VQAGFERARQSSSADALSQLAQLSRAFEQQDLGYLQYLMGVYQTAQSQRFGSYSTTTQTDPGMDPWAGALLGGAQGLQLATDLQDYKNAKAKGKETDKKPEAPPPMDMMDYYYGGYSGTGSLYGGVGGYEEF
jgi:hypothetical protein